MPAACPLDAHGGADVDLGDAPRARIEVRLRDVADGQIAPDQDLFQPAYYLSSALAEDTEINLDRIARRDESWQSPIDWKRFVTRFGQKVTVALNVRPQWKHLRQYGRHARKQEK